jgi:AraC-like DNA-binding protein
VQHEREWHRPVGSGDALASRWTDRGDGRTFKARTPPDRYVVRVFLHATRLRLMSDGELVAHGAVASGSLHVSLPGEHLDIAFEGPCDSLQWYLSRDFVRAAAEDMGCLSLLDATGIGGFSRDGVVEQLALALLAANAGLCLPGTAGRFALPVLSRIFQLSMVTRADGVDPVRVSIPSWRMQRVDAYIRLHIGEPISLAAVAASAGLSPMHFASRFRLATGQRPHHYILRTRIEEAKTLLMLSERSVVEVAGDVGFRTQSHFTTIFKRFTGATPCAWRRQHALQACPA